MAVWLIALVMVIYAYCGVEFLYRHDYGLAIVYLSYAASNIGLIMIAIHK